ncbi:hypothetical protein [Flavobacterium urocaniciphilum]|uniref:Uncharacterized protein n=1 Tax=Flavobacterium urocaniciphilum TaxID=1299341 RepID=A0A1H8Z6U1_9FLAO|nr:hypothetical protein [Flavobacterium urocaniciphilum]SEP60041.1 hypothetical protein SAMN05444005_101521 [Flavobacterium urocaniciphilum]
MRAIVKKSIKALVIITLVGLFFSPTEMFSQGPPPWAPAKGYRAKTRHIYFPQHNFYYDIQKRVYFYLNNGTWSVSVSIPAPFISINLGGATQIQLDYYGNYPYYFNNDHCTRYKVVKVKKHKPKKVIVIDEHHHHNDNDNDQGNGHGNKHKGHGKGHGKH